MNIGKERRTIWIEPIEEEPDAPVEPEPAKPVEPVQVPEQQASR